MKFDQMTEQILQAWLDVSAAIQNERIVKNMTYNEAIICDHLYRQSKMKPDYLTATQLCRKTGMQKSLMNRTVKSLIAKGLIVESVRTGDQRMKPLKFNHDNGDLFMNTHDCALTYVASIMAKWPRDKAPEILSALQLIARSAEETNTELTQNKVD